MSSRKPPGLGYFSTWRGAAVAVGTVSLDAVWAHLPAELASTGWNIPAPAQLRAAAGSCWRRGLHCQARGRPSGQGSHATGGHRGARNRTRAPSLLRWPCAACAQRCAPPGSQRPGFQAFDTSVRSSFGALAGMHLDDQQWRQAARGPAMAGLGLGSTAIDAPAAYLASIGSCRALCAQIDEAFSDAVLLFCPHAAAAADELNAALPPHQRVTVAAAIIKSEKDLTELIDAAAWRQQLANSTPTARALLLFETEVGARAFLAALPRGSSGCSGGYLVPAVQCRARSVFTSLCRWGTEPALGRGAARRPRRARVQKDHPAERQR